MGRLVANVDIVHSFQRKRNAGIYFHDDFLGMFCENRRIANARAQYNIAVFCYSRSFDYGYVHVSHEAVINQRTEMAQMAVNIMDAFIVDSFAEHLV